jgi:hypothetical protein
MRSHATVDPTGRISKLTATADQIALHFTRLLVYKRRPHYGASIMATTKSLTGFSMLLLLVAAVFGALNTSKMKSLRGNLANVTAARDTAERRRLDEQKTRDREVNDAKSKTAQNEKQIAQSEADLVKLQTEKSDLQAKLQAAQADAESWRQKAEQSGAKPEENPGAPSAAEAMAQLTDARQRLEGAERENAMLSEELRKQQSRTGPPAVQRKIQREAGPAKTEVHGTILAVNQAYNFVVLNLGGRQGVEPNSEMLVVRDGALIGKIRVSSVEPSTAIGDIITSSLERGVQVQPGDIVIYAGSGS